MTRRTYAGGAVPTTLASSMDASTLSINTASIVGWPDGIAGPFVVCIDRNTASEEKILCTSISGTVITGMQRGYDGTSAQTHSVTAPVEHTISAIDLDEANAHVNSTTSIHGLGPSDGTLVGTAKTQTLTNKTLTSPILSTPVVNQPTINGSGGALSLPAGPDVLVGRATTDTLTNKTLTTPTINNPALSGPGGVLTLPGTTDTLVARNTTETLTNKTLTSPTINSAAINTSTLTTPTIVDGTAQPSVIGNKALIVKGLVSQSANIFEVQNSGGTSLFSVQPAGQVQVPTNLNVNGTSALNGSSTASNLTTGGANTGVGLTLKAPSSGGGDICRFTDNTGGTVYASIDNAGRFVNKIPSAITRITANSSATSGAAELTVLTAGAITGDGTTKVKLSCSFFGINASVTNDVFELRIKNGATQLAAIRYRCILSGSVETGGSFFVDDVPAAGSQTYTVTLVRLAGTGTALIAAATTTPMVFAVEQL